MNNWHWPYAWMWSSLITAGLAAFLPWLLPKWHKVVPPICALVAVVTFIAHEVDLYSDVPANTVIFQIEIYLLAPLLVVALLSCGLVVYLGKEARTWIRKALYDERNV